MKEQKLLIVDIGNIFYNNTDISLTNEEANTLVEVHRVLFQKGLVTDLQELFNFFNFSREATCPLR